MKILRSNDVSSTIVNILWLYASKSRALVNIESIASLNCYESTVLYYATTRMFRNPVCTYPHTLHRHRLAMLATTGLFPDKKWVSQVMLSQSCQSSCFFCLSNCGDHFISPFCPFLIPIIIVFFVIIAIINCLPQTAKYIWVCCTCIWMNHWGSMISLLVYLCFLLYCYRDQSQEKYSHRSGQLLYNYVLDHSIIILFIFY